MLRDLEALLEVNFIAGLMARSVADIQFLDSILSDCPKEAHNVSLSGLRIGYPREWWSDVGQEVCVLPSTACHDLIASTVAHVKTNPEFKP